MWFVLCKQQSFNWSIGSSDATILDRCDGEVARITLKESKFGQWFDTALDQLSYFSMFIGIATCLNNPSFFSFN